MSTLFLLEPEVAGGLGPNTIITNEDKIKSGQDQNYQIEYLEYVMDDWLGDDLLTSYPVFIITELLASNISASQLKGVKFGQVHITKSELFEDINSDFNLPSFVRLLPQGKVELIDKITVSNWSGEDLCLSQNNNLIVTEVSLNLFRRHTLQYCNIRHLIFN